MVLVRQVWQVLVVQGLLCDLAGACGPLRDMPAGKQRVCNRCQNANGCGINLRLPCCSTHPPDAGGPCSCFNCCSVRVVAWWRFSMGCKHMSSMHAHLAQHRQVCCEHAEHAEFAPRHQWARRGSFGGSYRRWQTPFAAMSNALASCAAMHMWVAALFLRLATWQRIALSERAWARA